MESFIPSDDTEFGEVLDTNKIFIQALRKRLDYIVLGIIVSLLWDALCIFILLPKSILYSDVGFGILAIPWGICFIFLFALYAKIREAFWNQLANKYGWEYYPNKNIVDEKALVFNLGHTKIAQHGIRGKYNDQPFQIFEYAYSVGSGKSKTTYEFTIFEIKFTGTFPHLYLNYKDDGYANTPSFFASLAKISVPKEFENKFKLYAPKEYEIETLEIFTPDIFSHLLEEKWNHDMEFVDGELVIYSRILFNSFTELDAELTKIKKFIDILSPRLNRLKLAQIGDISASLRQD